MKEEALPIDEACQANERVQESLKNTCVPLLKNSLIITSEDEISKCTLLVRFAVSIIREIFRKCVFADFLLVIWNSSMMLQYVFLKMIYPEHTNYESQHYMLCNDAYFSD